MNRSKMLLSAAILIAGSLGFYSLFVHESETEPEMETMVAVNVAKVQKMTMRNYVVAYGSVETDPGNGTSMPAAVTITAPADGIIAQVSCLRGQKVNKDDALFRLDSRIVDLAVEKAQQAVAFAQKNFERQTKLQKIEGTSDKLYLEARQALENARADLANANAQRSLLTVAAPFSGTIVQLDVNAGQTVAMADELARLCDLDRLVVTASIPSREVTQLQSGQTVEIDNSLSRTHVGSLVETVTGTLSYIDPQVDARMDTVIVRAAIAAGSGLRAGQFVRMRIITEVRPDCLAVPRESVYTDHDGQSTLSIVEGDVARQEIVTTGLREGDFIQVEGDGVTEGATVVTLGSYALPPETKVSILPSANTEVAK